MDRRVVRRALESAEERMSMARSNEPESRAALRIATFASRHGTKLAFVVALTAMLGSLYYSEVRDFIPCELCWYQRILMYPLSAFLLISILTSDTWIPRYVLPLSLFGVGLSTYHYLIQNAFVHNSGFCNELVSCSLRYVNYFGFVTIPFMAQVGFALITLIMLVVVWAQRWLDDAEAGD